MSDDWPGKWRSAQDKQLEEADAMPDNDEGVSFTNDHGTLYVIGEMENGEEWLSFESEEPAHELRQ